MGITRQAKPVVRAVDGVSFQIKPGETLGLVGESGSGKTTIARAILRLEQETDGAILFDGRDLSKLRRGELGRLRRRIQMVFQDPYNSLNPQTRVGAAVAEPLIVHRLVVNSPAASANYSTWSDFKGTSQTASRTSFQGGNVSV
jgi:ABC-type glutathione transport system ATPase component